MTGWIWGPKRCFWGLTSDSNGSQLRQRNGYKRWRILLWVFFVCSPGPQEHGQGHTLMDPQAEAGDASLENIKPGLSIQKRHQESPCKQHSSTLWQSSTLPPALDTGLILVKYASNFWTTKCAKRSNNWQVLLYGQRWEFAKAGPLDMPQNSSHLHRSFFSTEFPSPEARPTVTADYKPNINLFHASFDQIFALK